ncbi:MAG: transporter substrate-binding domain-containing protein [Acidobacteriota bacterium]|nr:transporter substrate-binding domain-containing protein [Acidobacteriota bacterium]
MINRIYFGRLRNVLLMHTILVFCVSAVLAQQKQLPQPSTMVVAPRSNVDTLAEIKKSGKLRVGVAKIVPWAFHDKNDKTNKLVGFEIDVARKLARDLGVEVEFYPVHFDYLISDLLAERFDIIISGLSITAERALKVNFSAPYNVTNLTLAANQKMSKGFNTVESFNKKGITIGVVEGTTSEEIGSLTFPNAKIKHYEEDSALFQDLTENKINAAISDAPRPEAVARSFPGVITTPLKPLATYPAAFAVRRGDSDFINFLNSWIQERTVNGYLENRRKHWFDSFKWWERL